jgi:hypothetical protein
VASAGGSSGIILSLILLVVPWVAACAFAIPWTTGKQFLMEWILPMTLATGELLAVTYVTKLWQAQSGFGFAEYGFVSLSLFPPLFSAVLGSARSAVGTNR